MGWFPFGITLFLEKSRFRSSVKNLVAFVFRVLFLNNYLCLFVCTCSCFCVCGCRCGGESGGQCWVSFLYGSPLYFEVFCH